MTYKLDYNFLKLEFKGLYNEIIEIEAKTDLEVISKSILKLLKDIIEISYRDNKIIWVLKKVERKPSIKVIGLNHEATAESKSEVENII